MKFVTETSEILAPAGSFEAVTAAVRAGADAVYIGAKNFSARAGAQNFDMQGLKDAAVYCHARNVKVYLAVNTLMTDSDLPLAIQTVKEACLLPVDALIVQDTGLVRLLRQICPGMPLHGSTQMSVHTPGGAKLLYEQGFKRVVLARELSFAEIRQIRQSCPIELEVFVHGALCMSVSGQCYLSAVLGGRSGNRGRCAQPCRLPFRVNGGTGFDLSLKDLSLLSHLQELQALGIHSFKIEGRMKRPEYVYASVRAARHALANGEISQQESKCLNDIFSRSGFTDGYYRAQLGRDMFGTRSKNNVLSATDRLLAQIRTQYKDEAKRIPVFFNLSVLADTPVTLSATDGQGHTAVCRGEIPQTAEHIALRPEQCAAQLQKTGGTPFFCAETTCTVKEGLSLPLSSLNRLRRETLEKLLKELEKRTPVLCSTPGSMSKQVYTASSKAVRARFTDTDIPACFSACEWVYVPLFTPKKELSRLLNSGFATAVEIPRGMFGHEIQIQKQLRLVKACGITHALANTLGAVHTALEQGFTVHGGFGLNLMNTQALHWAQETGLCDTELSFELTKAQVNTLGGTMKRGFLAYGRLPLMLTRNCPQKNAGITCATCKKQALLTDRKNEKFPLQCAYTCTEVLNCVPLCLYDRIDEFTGVDFCVLRFSVENYVEKEENFWAFKEKKRLNKAITRGLYYRGVQ